MVIGQSDDVDTETPRQPGSATAAVARLENEQLCASHQRGPHERLAARVGAKRRALDACVAMVNIRLSPRRRDRPAGRAHFPQPLSRMMMPYDSSLTPPSRLDEATVAAVREALRGYLANGGEPGALQGALKQMSVEARERDLRAEQLLVVLKDVWGSLPEVRAMTDAGTHVRLLQRVVTMCIKEYYTP